jgi:hypothetical protein
MQSLIALLCPLKARDFYFRLAHQGAPPRVQRCQWALELPPPKSLDLHIDRTYAAQHAPHSTMRQQQMQLRLVAVLPADPRLECGFDMPELQTACWS